MEDRHKNYRAWDAQHSCQKPVSPQEALPEGDLVFFLLDVIPPLDLSPFHRHYAQEMRGQPPFDVRFPIGHCVSPKIVSAHVTGSAG